MGHGALRKGSWRDIGIGRQLAGYKVWNTEKETFAIPSANTMRGTFNIYCSVAVVTKLQVAFETCPATCPGASYCRCPPLRMSDFYELLFTSCVFVPCLPRVVPPPPIWCLSPSPRAGAIIRTWQEQFARGSTFMLLTSMIPPI